MAEHNGLPVVGGAESESILTKAINRERQAAARDALAQVETLSPQELENLPLKDLQKVFLEVLRQTGNVSGSARLVGRSRRTIYTWRENDPDFAKAWAEAYEEGVDQLEAEARRRAEEGVLEPVWHQGMVVGYKVAYSDTLMNTMLRALRPEKYNPQHHVKIEGQVQHDHGMELSPDLLAQAKDLGEQIARGLVNGAQEVQEVREQGAEVGQIEEVSSRDLHSE